MDHQYSRAEQHDLRCPAARFNEKGGRLFAGVGVDML